MKGRGRVLNITFLRQTPSTLNPLSQGFARDLFDFAREEGREFDEDREVEELLLSGIKDEVELISSAEVSELVLRV